MHNIDTVEKCIYEDAMTIENHFLKPDFRISH
jgi:hypothetical protein